MKNGHTGIFRRILIRFTILAMLVGQTGEFAWAADEDFPKTLDWQGYLAFAGSKCDFQFTIDRVASADEPRAEFKAEADFSTADDFIKKMSPRLCWLSFTPDEKHKRVIHVIDKIRELTKRIPHVTAIKDSKRPEIVHLIDKELLKLRDYALDQKLTVDFRGSPLELAASLKEKGIKAGPKISDATLKATGGSDTETLLKVHAEDDQVRMILTDGFSKTKENHGVLWHARTWVKADGPHTSIEFRQRR